MIAAPTSIVRVVEGGGVLDHGVWPLQV